MSREPTDGTAVYEEGQATFEFPVSPLSGFWYYHEEVDYESDPLLLMIKAEEGDEVP